MKKFLNISALTLGFILVVIIALLISVQTPRIQTILAKKAISALQENLGGDIEFSSIQIHPFDALVLKDVAIIDRDPYKLDGVTPIDTIMRARNIVATFSLKGLFKKEGIHVERAYISDAVFNFVNESQSSNIQRFLNIKKKEEKKEMGNIFDASNIEIQNMRFRMVNFKSIIQEREESDRASIQRPTPKGVINWKDLDIKIIDIKAKNLKMSQGYMSGNLVSAEFKEKSGYHVSDLSGKTKVGHGKTIIENLHLADNWTIAELPELTFTYDNTKSWGEFLTEVRINGQIRSSKIDLRSLSYFSSSLKGRSMIADVSEAKVEGYVSDLHIKKFRAYEELSGMSFNIKGSITGLPDSQGMLTNLQDADISFTTDGLGKFIRGWAPQSALDLSAYAPDETFTFKGTGSGPLNRMAINGTISSNIGSVYADLDIRNLIDPEHAIRIGTYLNAHNVNVGRIAGINAVKECSLKTALSTTLTPGSVSFKIDSVIVSKANVLGYEYTGIVANGIYENGSFDGKVVANDPNLNFLFQGILNISKANPNAVYKFYANLGYADLNALHIDNRGESKLSGQVSANYINAKGDLTGAIDVKNMKFQDSSGKHDVGDISISSHSNDDIYRINLNSAFAHGRYVGTKNISDLIKEIQDATIKKEIPALFKTGAQTQDYGEYSLAIDLHDTRDILSLVYPGLYIADSTSLSVNMTKEGIASANLKSQRIALGSKYIKDMDLQFDNNEGSLNAKMKSSALSIGALEMLDDQFILYADNNNIGIGYSYDNNSEKDNKGEIFLTGMLQRDQSDSLSIKAQTLPSNIYYEGTGWSIKSSSISIKGGDIKIDNLVTQCSDQFIAINGGISSNRADTLSLEMEKFDLGILNTFLGEKYDLQGLVTGTAMMISPTKTDLGLTAGIRCDSTYFAGERVGNLSIISTFDDGRIHLTAENDLDHKNTLALAADFFPSSRTIDATVGLNGVNAAYAYPFLSSLFSDMGGSLEGKIHAYGPLDNLSFESEGTRFRDVEILLDFTKVRYIANGPIHLDSTGLHFDNVDVHDQEDGYGTLSGAVTFDHLRDLGTDIHIRFDSIKCLSLDEGDNDSFYGDIYATGSLSITGPLNSILLDADAMTVKEGSFHIPMGSSSVDSSSDLLVFTQEEHYVEIDPYDLMMSKMIEQQKKAGNDLSVKLKIEATPTITAYIEVDKESGNVLTARGAGNITVDVTPSKGAFSLGGDYNITDGGYHFNAMNLAKRNFTIQEGSSVRFNGDIMDTELDIDAIYTTKTSLSNLIADSTSVASRRTVECGIAITDKFNNPQIAFSINVPDLDPTTKSLVESALNTEDKIQKQFLYLLIANSFLPDEQSGIATNNSNMLYSNVAQMMANQLNNIMEKLDIPLDLGLTYQSDDRGQNIFDVAVSTQLFNNRVIVNGTVGSRQYASSGSNDEMVGDLDIEVKIDPTGQFRFNLFSHSADDYTNYLDNTQRNGVGVTYQKEFNTFREAIKSIFTNKKRQQRRQERLSGKEEGQEHLHIYQEKPIQKDSMITIQIKD